MLIDARQIPAGSQLDADVCIVGAGAAGITIACELAGRPLKVCLLESGGFDFEDATQALYQGQVTGHPLNAPDISRLRYFGGTTNHWGGICAPLDADDFRVRPWLQYSGWPITRTDLDPFYRRAAPYVQISSADFDPGAWADEIPPLFRNKRLGNRVAPLLFQLSPPTRFGEVYRERLASAAAVQVLLHANVLAFDTDPGGQVVEAVRVGCLDGNRFSVRAGAYVLATGGIENARLLLVSNAAQQRGLGNQHDMVGRFFMGHPQIDNVARIVFDAPSGLAAKPLASILHTYVIVKVAEATAAQEQIAKFGAHLDPLASATAKMLRETPPYLAFKRLVARVMGTSFPDATVVGDVDAVITDMRGLLRGLYTRFGSASILDIRPQCEQVPNPHSRVMLSDERDALSLPRVKLDWQLTDLDVVSIRRGLAIVGEAFAGAGLGHIELSDAIREATPRSIECTEDWHHIGTTRMSEDPRVGVVDRNCRVHGVNNLYVAGSSVFPTTSVVNPTYTIVALAIRLADHIQGHSS